MKGVIRIEKVESLIKRRETLYDLCKISRPLTPNNILIDDDRYSLIFVIDGIFEVENEYETIGKILFILRNKNLTINIILHK